MTEENPKPQSNRATLIAAALIITGSTAIFGTYAAGKSNDIVPPSQNPVGCYQEYDRRNNDIRTNEQKTSEPQETTFEIESI